MKKLVSILAVFGFALCVCFGWQAAPAVADEDDLIVHVPAAAETGIEIPDIEFAKLPKSSYTTTIKKARIYGAQKADSFARVEVQVPTAESGMQVTLYDDTARRYDMASDSWLNDAEYVGTDANLAKHVVVFALTQAGVHTLKFQVGDAGYQCKVTVKAKKVAGKGYLMMYQGQVKQLKASLVDAGWASSNPEVVEVDETGLWHVVGLGRATITATSGSTTVTYLVESTYKKAYKAVKNALVDLNSGLRYSQGLRMKKKYRDCSSFVSRVYWDNKLGRKLVAIGGKKLGGYALPAADQAAWLYKHGKAVANKRVSVKKLLPGDTIYTWARSSTGGGFRGINHACLDVGNGKVLDGGMASSTHNRNTVAYRSYKKLNIRFIGRPCK